MRRLATAVALALTFLVGTALPAAADTTRSWDVTIDVEPDGTFTVEERIRQEFTTSRRGIFRYIPVTEAIAENGLVTVPDGEVADWFQRIRLDDIKVTSPTAPDATLVERPSRHESGGVVSIRIGEEDTYITGAHDYTIRYRVIGAMLPGDDGTSLLRWDVVGGGWQQDIDVVHVEVRGDGIIAEGSVCAAGIAFASDGCEARVSTGSFEASVAGIAAFVPVSVQVVFDADQVAASEPILQRRWTLAGALAGDSRALPLTLMTLLVGLGSVGRLLFREGRDRETRGDVTVDGRTDTTHMQYLSAERSRPMFTPRPFPIEFRPPDDLRPGELGLIIDERVDPIDVAATIVDLAVRGHLVIEEKVSKTLWWTNTDWTLRRTDKGPDGLLSYEEFLYDGLFSGRSEVDVSDLKGTFSAEYAKAEKALYEQGRKRGWFAGRPDKVRTKWLVIGVLSFIAAVAAFFLALYLTRMALAALPLVLAGLVLLVAHRWMPRRTPKGSELLTRTLGFREFIETAETDRAQFAEKEHLFIEYLPYAVVFGATEKWAKAFADLAILTSGAGLGGWYVFHAGSSGVFDGRAFSSGLADFSSSVGSAAVTAPPSSGGGSGGFSGGGGGFGGGGGGSW